MAEHSSRKTCTNSMRALRGRTKDMVVFDDQAFLPILNGNFGPAPDMFRGLLNHTLTKDLPWDIVNELCPEDTPFLDEFQDTELAIPIKEFQAWLEAHASPSPTGGHLFFENLY